MLSGLRRLAPVSALAFGLGSLACGSPSAPRAPSTVTTSAARAAGSAGPAAPPPNPHRPFGKLEDVRPGSGFGSPCYAHDGSLYRYEISGDRTAPWRIVRIDLDSRKETDIWRGETMGDLSFDDGGVIKVVDRGVVRIPLAGGPPRLYQLEGAADAAADKGQIWVRRVREVGDRGPTTELVRIATDTGVVTQVATLGPGLVTSTNNLFLSPTAIAVVSAPRRRLLVLDRAKPVLPEVEFALPAFYTEADRPEVENGELALEGSVSVALDGRTTYVVLNGADGHEVHAWQAGKFPRQLHADSRPWHVFAALQMDDAYLYYPVTLPSDSDQRLSLLRMPKAGGEPEEIAKLWEGVTTAIDGDFIYLCSGASGTTQRIRIR